MPNIVPSLWFDTQAHEAAEHYCSIFPNSGIDLVTRYGDANPDRAGTVLTVEFRLDGTRFVALNGGPLFTFDEAVSFIVECDGQAEVDRYWEALLAGGGEEGPCGWLKDKYGLSWQIVPTVVNEILASGDEPGIERFTNAMYAMRKLDVAALQAAFRGEPVDA